MGASAKDLSEGGSEEKRRRKKMVHTETKKEEKTNNDLGGASPEQRQCVGSDVMQRSKWRRSRVLSSLTYKTRVQTQTRITTAPLRIIVKNGLTHWVVRSPYNE